MSLLIHSFVKVVYDLFIEKVSSRFKLISML